MESIGNEFRKLYRNSVANHLLDVRFISNKLKVLWKRLNPCAFFSCQRANIAG